MDARIKSGHDTECGSPTLYPSVFMLPTSGADGETPSLASSAAMRVFSASFSSRASRAMSLTASNSSRLTMSRSRRIFSAWLRTTVSTSRLTPWAAPAASFIRRPISSKNRLLVWVISGISERLRRGRYVKTMAIRAARFKAGVVPSMRQVALSCSGFLAIVFNAQIKKPAKRERKAHDRSASRNSYQGRPHHHLHQPSRTRRPTSHRPFLHGRACDPRGTARHGAPARDLGLLRDAAEPVLPLWRHGAWTVAGGSRSARAQADVRVHELDQHSHGDGRYARPARLCRRPGRRAQGHCRYGRLLHERTLCDQRRDALSGTCQSCGIDLWNAPGHRPARQSTPRHKQDQGRTLFRLRGNRYLRTDGDHRKSESGNERRPCRGRDLSRHPSRLRVSEASGL